MTGLIEQICQKLYLDDKAIRVTQSDAFAGAYPVTDMPWAKYAIQLGYNIGMFDKQDTRVVACITCPETPLISLLIGFGILLASDHSDHIDKDPDLLTFTRFMELDESQPLFWVEEIKGKKKIIQGHPGDIHDEYGGGRWIHQRGARSARRMVFRDNFFRFEFQFSNNQAKQRTTEAENFYRSLGVGGIRYVFSAHNPRVITHGKKGETLALASKLCVSSDPNKNVRVGVPNLLNLTSSKRVGEGATRIWADKENMAALNCHTAIISSSRNFENLVQGYASSNVVFLFNNSEFTDHALTLISGLSGTTPHGFPEPPRSIRCRLFEIKRRSD